MAALFRQFSFPGGVPSHCAPETPGLVPRRRRARLLAAARVRRGARQPGPRRVLRRRRRRGRDRAARDELALRPSSSTRPATARCCRSCTSTSTRSPTRRCSPGSPRPSCSTLLRGYGYDPHVVAGDDPADGPPGDGGRAGHAASTAIAEMQRRAPAAPATHHAAGCVADDRAAHAEGLDLPAGRRRPAGRGHVPRAPGAAARRLATTTSTARVLEAVAAVVPARGALRRRRPPDDRAAGRSPRRRRAG